MPAFEKASSDHWRNFLQAVRGVCETHSPLSVASVSGWLFLGCRCLLALGEAGNFPAAIKVTAEYFPPKDRAFATSIFNAGSSVGALFTYAAKQGDAFAFGGYTGKPAGYMVVFCYCAVAYLLGWACMKALVPKEKKVTL